MVDLPIGIHMFPAVVSPHDDVPLYRQVAELLRAQIIDGTIAPGEELRSEPDLCHEYEVGRKTIRDALAVLRGEGLIESRRGARSRVRVIPELVQVPVPAGVVVQARMPTPNERKRLALPPGVPVLVVGPDVYRADQYAVIMGSEQLQDQLQNKRE